MTMRLEWATLCREPELSKKASLVRCPVCYGKKKKTIVDGLFLFGSPNWARTSDIMINSHALYRLSYRGIARSRADYDLISVD